jgi:TIR domain-containing protein
LGAHGKIFVSYRRDDAPGDARSIHDRLGRSFGEANVFMDVDQLLAGQRFDRELDKALAKCDVLIAVIGSRWMDLLSEHARRGKRDYVRDEIAAALQRDIIVIPVMMGREANMPPLPLAAELPENIRDLVLYQKHNVAHESFGRDAAHLIAALQSLLHERRGPWRAIAVTGVSGLALTGVLLGYWMGIAPRVQPSTQHHIVADNLTIAAVPKSDAASNNAAAERVFGAASALPAYDNAKPKPSTEAAEPALNIAGRWRDNWGITYDVEQEGHAFRFSASGPSCSGYFRASGSGTISGVEVQSSYSAAYEGNYSSNLRSGGQCTGELFANGTKMNSRCDDTICGKNSFSLAKQ